MRVIDARFVEKRLMPGNERRRLPAFLVVESQHRVPVAQAGHAFPLAPPALLLWQLHGEVDLDRHRLALRHGLIQRNDQCRGVAFFTLLGRFLRNFAIGYPKLSLDLMGLPRHRTRRGQFLRTAGIIGGFILDPVLIQLVGLLGRRFRLQYRHLVEPERPTLR